MLIQRMRDGSEGIMAKIIIGLICIVFALFGFESKNEVFTTVSIFFLPWPVVGSLYFFSRGGGGVTNALLLRSVFGICDFHYVFAFFGGEEGEELESVEPTATPLYRWFAAWTFASGPYLIRRRWPKRRP